MRNTEKAEDRQIRVEAHRLGLATEGALEDVAQSIRGFYFECSGDRIAGLNTPFVRAVRGSGRVSLRTWF